MTSKSKRFLRGVGSLINVYPASRINYYEKLWEGSIDPKAVNVANAWFIVGNVMNSQMNHIVAPVVCATEGIEANYDYEGTTPDRYTHIGG